MNNFKNLMLRSNVKLTPAIVRSLELIDPYFSGEPSWISSGLRTAIDQITIITKKVVQHKIDTLFEEFKAHLGSETDFKIEVDGESLYWWQRAWSKLLNLGDIVNPPHPSVVLFEYFRPGSHENKKGHTVDISPHMKGKAFDIEGNDAYNEKAKRVMKAYQEGTCYIAAYLPEKINNAIHVDVQPIG